jgi:glyceraldehyde 3-phosphate dehydrogenase
MVAEVAREVTVEEINEAMRESIAGYPEVIEYVDDPIVSTDVRMNSHSGVFDSLATMVIGGTLVKTVTWFNNGWGYSHRVIEVAERIASKGVDR